MSLIDTRVDTRLLSIGQLITIVPESPSYDRLTEAEEYPSRVEDVQRGAVVVSMPMRRRSLVPLPVDTAVSAYFNRSGARYYFRAVVGPQAETPFPVLQLRHVGDMRRVERRAHARVDACVELVDMVVVDGNMAKGPNERSTLIVNISAGGLGMVCRQRISRGSDIQMALELPLGFGRLEAEARVVRCVEMDLGPVKKWKVGVAFKDVSEEQRDRISGFVLYQQQLLRRRGLL